MLFRKLQEALYPSSEGLILVENFVDKRELQQPRHIVGFPGGASGKEPACQCRRCKRCKFNPWVQEDPLEKEVVTHSSMLA